MFGHKWLRISHHYVNIFEDKISEHMIMAKFKMNNIELKTKFDYQIQWKNNTNLTSLIDFQSFYNTDTNDRK